jgi:hypothetical protein
MEIIKFHAKPMKYSIRDKYEPYIRKGSCFGVSGKIILLGKVIGLKMFCPEIIS